MNADPKSPSLLLAGLFSDVAWIRVRGRGSFLISPQLRAFAERMIAEGQKRLAVDLEECTYMDSTFLGTITAIALRIQADPAARLEILNCDAKMLRSFRTLGLDQILEIDEDGSSWPEERALVQENVHHPIEEVDCDPECRRQVAFDAHEALCKANSENINRFRDVLEYLERKPAGS